MEASKYGFGEDTPPAFKFDPTDADLVAHYLLPRALGLHNPHAHAIIEDDPGSVPPWELLGRHGHVAAADHVVQAFFFGPPADPSQNGGRKSRTVQGGGVWQGQKGTEHTVTLLRPGGGSEVDIRYKLYDLTFSRTKGGPSSGYVMHEFEILSPPLPGAVLTRIRVKKGAYRPPGAEQQAAIHVPDPYQPGPSYEYDAAAANGEGFAGAQDGALYDSNCYYGGAPLGYDYDDLPVAEFKYDDSYSYRMSIQDQSGTSYNCNAAQANAFYGGGGMVEAAGAYYDPTSYVPECGAEYSNYYGEYH